MIVKENKYIIRYTIEIKSITKKKKNYTVYLQVKQQPYVNNFSFSINIRFFYVYFLLRSLKKLNFYSIHNKIIFLFN